MDSNQQNPLPSDDKVQELVLEEKLRARIRSELEPDKPDGRSKAWKFLNSPFGLFLLGSVLISGLGHVYTERQHQAELNKIREQELIKVASEFEYRLNQVEYLAERLMTPGVSSDEQRGVGVLLWRVVVGDAAYQPSLPEFKSIHWSGLVTRLRLLGISELADETTSTILKIETDKDSAWRYEMKKLTEHVSLVRKYRDKLRLKLRGVTFLGTIGLRTSPDDSSKKRRSKGRCSSSAPLLDVEYQLNWKETLEKSLEILCGIQQAVVGDGEV